MEENLTVYEFMEDFDNNELDPTEWKEQLIEAVLDYNRQYNTSYDPEKTFVQYNRRQANSLREL